jgi:hypothetical protein
MTLPSCGARCAVFVKTKVCDVLALWRIFIVPIIVGASMSFVDVGVTYVVFVPRA